MNWISFISGAMCASIFAFLIHTVDVDHIKIKQKDAITAQITADGAACAASQAITKGTNDALQKDRDHIAAELVALRLRTPAKCVSVSSKANISASRKTGHAGKDGISSDWLLNYGAECEQYRTEIIACTNFIDKVLK